MTPIDSPMHHITDVISWNHYFGWYGGKMKDHGSGPAMHGIGLILAVLQEMRAV